MLINHKPWLTCRWLTRQCYYTETLLTRFLQVYCSQSPTSFFIFFMAFWWIAFKILMSSNHSYIHSLPYREAQGRFKMSEWGLREPILWRQGAPTSQGGGIQATLHSALYGDNGVWRTIRPLDFGRWEKEGKGLNFCMMPTKMLGDIRSQQLQQEPKTKHEHFFRDPCRLLH